MQRKFKIGGKVKVLTKAYHGTYGTEGVITKVGLGVCMVDRNADKYPSDQYGTFDTDAWRYCFYEEELELVTDQEVSNTEPNVQITVNIDENICAAFNEVKNGLEILLSGNTEPDYVIGQEVYVSNDFNRYLRKGVLLNAIPRNGLIHVNIGGFDCYVEEERVYTREEAKRN